MYVNNDPVNYVDLWGLSAGDAKSVWDGFTGAGNPYANYGVSTIIDSTLSSDIAEKTTNYVNDFRCDMYAWNSAVSDGVNPKGQNGEDWDIDRESVSDIYNKFPVLRFVAPQNNTKGFAFYFNDMNDEPVHIEYYDNTNDVSETYVQYKTDGKNAVETVDRKINDDRNLSVVYVVIYSE
ncbi:hypothetical protein Trebr_1332 [Treponema brennaborense DSM 12168]|uniref:Uncharacterized protein n=1 Tax=Treponema brennaborense (strain DSM 12168 / CIP 105900 / DD5/3) TaxID=906968 RepID=F4LML0_TREBD|nr:hypothetical protein Trebr_1332 [Treponema brennaborense DSM 12168]